MTHTVINRILFIIISILLSIIILLNCVQIVAYDINYYKSQYYEHDIYKRIGIEESELIKSTQKLLDYIKDKRDNIDFKANIRGEMVDFFSERDKMHMIDVKKLFQTGYIIRNGLAAIFIAIIILLKFKNGLKVDIGKFLLLFPIMGVIPFFILIILIKIDFNRYFTIFHELFFKNDLWLLDPVTDRLVNIFPEEFFVNTAIRILMFYFAIQFAFFIIGFLGIYRNNRAKIK